MLYQAHIKAIDDHGMTISESTIPPGTRQSVCDFEEEFTDRLARRGVLFSRIVIDMAVTHPVRPKGGYIGIFDLV